MIGNYILEQSTSPGVATTIVTTGAVSGYRSLASQIAVGAQFYGVLSDGVQHEVFIGTLNSATSVSRTQVLSNSAGSTARLNFSSATTKVYCMIPAERSAYFNGANVLDLLNRRLTGLAQPSTTVSSDAVSQMFAGWVVLSRQIITVSTSIVTMPIPSLYTRLRLCFADFTPAAISAGIGVPFIRWSVSGTNFATAGGYNVSIMSNSGSSAVAETVSTTYYPLAPVGATLGSMPMFGFCEFQPNYPHVAFSQMTWQSTGSAFPQVSHTACMTSSAMMTTANEVVMGGAGTSIGTGRFVLLGQI